jgi:hypothetical protein
MFLALAPVLLAVVVFHHMTVWLPSVGRFTRNPTRRSIAASRAVTSRSSKLGIPNFVTSLLASGHDTLGGDDNFTRTGKAIRGCRAAGHLTRIRGRRIE